jgi:trehalose 6-phosphate phosphatase
MRDILARHGRSALEALVAQSPLVAFDFDGTLARVAATPQGARLRPATRRLLRTLACLLPCAVISGRRRADVVRQLHGVPGIAIVGNHGLEPRRGLRPSPRVRSWRLLLAARIGRQPGVWIEDKRFTLAVHYRQAPSAARARRSILRTAATLAGARVLDGARVVDVVPRRAPDKGRALARLLAFAGRATAIYVGNDETDEAAFARALAAGGIAIRVGPRRRSRATYFLRHQWDIDELLRRLILTAGNGGATPRRARQATCSSARCPGRSARRHRDDASAAPAPRRRR